ncbi:MAG: DUF262 domain-containing protein, partial [Limisphaerales bacterium]
FQRGYEWGKKHVGSFWADIIQFEKERGMKAGPKRYFLGPIVVLQDKDGDDVIQLLDGQQRLATATILFSVLRDVAKSIGVKDGDDFARDIQNQFISKANGSYALKLGATDEQYFRDSIQSDTQVVVKPKLRTHRNIQTSRALLMEKVKGKVTGAAPDAQLTVLRSLRQILASDLVLACIPVESERDAFRIFETLNDRGLRLSVPDLLLNYLMRQAKTDVEQKQVREHWTGMIERMGKRDINRFLRHMWVSKYGDLKSQDLFSELKDHIEQNSVSSLEFARACKDECEFYVQLVSLDTEHLKNSHKYVRSLLTGLDAQSSLPLLLSAYQKLPPADFVKVCQWALVFIVRFSVIAGKDAAGLENVMFALARDVRNLTAAKDGVKPDPKACMTHVKESLTKNSPTDDQLKSEIPALILSPDDAGYFMACVANHLQSATKETKADEANLEHIYPKNPAENAWGGAAGQEQLEPYLWHVGNLTILGERLNKGVGNGEFPVKKECYGKNSELLITQNIAKDYTEWNVKNIQDRAAKLLAPVLEVWNFQNSSRV